MNLKLTNKNYCATIVEIKNIIPLENCDNVVATQIFGNQVIIGKDVNIGDVGLFFPIECQLSKDYLSTNNLYRKKELNIDLTKAGYFEENGRIRCVKFRGNKSEGLYMPIDSIAEFIDKGDQLCIGDEFNTINEFEICKKYIIPVNTPGTPKNKKDKWVKKSRLIDGQFRFHEDTSQLGKNMHKIKPDSLLHISYKMHGTSAISSLILCKKKLTWYEAILKKLGINIIDTKYENIYSSRKVIKNGKFEAEDKLGFYDTNIWTVANDELKDYLTEGLTLYYEIVGYLPSNGAIQKDYDYGCEIGKHANYIYRITYTNTQGKVFEFSAKQVQDWCKEKGLNAVPELYYGYAKDFYDNAKFDENGKREYSLSSDEEDLWRTEFLNCVKTLYNEKNCYICKHKVPEEGCVVRIEGLEFEAYKCKSNAFYERETKQLDKGEIDIESEES